MCEKGDVRVVTREAVGNDLFGSTLGSRAYSSIDVNEPSERMMPPIAGIYKTVAGLD
jgi:hypothetical protein